METKKKKISKKRKEAQIVEEPKKLSKAGEWLRSGKGKGLITIVDMKAVLK